MIKYIFAISFIFLNINCTEKYEEIPEVNNIENNYFGELDTASLKTVSINGIELEVEIARTQDARAKGLMFRDSLAFDNGMLFIFESPQILQFWMKNTKIPLDIAFIDSKGIIIEIYKLEPFNETTVSSQKYALYALEVNGGWFEKNNIVIGDKLIFR